MDNSIAKKQPMKPRRQSSRRNVTTETNRLKAHFMQDVKDIFRKASPDEFWAFVGIDPAKIPQLAGKS